MSEDEKANSSVKSLHVALDILEAVAASREEIGVSELTQRLGMTKGSVFRYMKTLVQRGYLAQNASTARYGLGMRLHIMGKLASDRIDLLSVSEQVMLQLRNRLALTVNLATRGRTGVVVLRSLVATKVMEIGIPVGSVLPFNATSQGRVIMAFARDNLLERLRKQDLSPFTSHSLTDFDAVAAEVARARRQGWAEASQEIVLGINAVSAPIMAADGDCSAALTLVGSVQHLGPDPAQIEALRAAGLSVSRALGFRGAYPGTGRPA